MSDWQEMDTAPKDAKEFLVCLPRQGRVLLLVRWNTVHKYWQSKGERQFFHDGDLWHLAPELPERGRLSNLRERLRLGNADHHDCMEAAEEMAAQDTAIAELEGEAVDLRMEVERLKAAYQTQYAATNHAIADADRMEAVVEAARPCHSGFVAEGHKATLRLAIEDFDNQTSEANE